MTSLLLDISTVVLFFKKCHQETPLFYLLPSEDAFNNDAYDRKTFFYNKKCMNALDVE